MALLSFLNLSSYSVSSFILTCLFLNMYSFAELIFRHHCGLEMFNIS